MKHKLADIAAIVVGGTPSTANPDYWNGDILWVTPKDLSLLNGAKYIYNTISHISDCMNETSSYLSVALMPKFLASVITCCTK